MQSNIMLTLSPFCVFDIQACCNYHFSWNDNCLLESEVADITALAGGQAAAFPFYPSSQAHECLTDGKQPDWLMESLYDNAEV